MLWLKAESKQLWLVRPGCWLLAGANAPAQQQPSFQLALACLISRCSELTMMRCCGAKKKLPPP